MSDAPQNATTTGGELPAEAPPNSAADAAPTPLPRRLFDTFFSPGKMATEVAANPRWLGALLVAIVLVTTATALIPPDILAEFQRRAALERGVTMPELTDRALSIIRIFSIVGPMVAFALIALVMAGVYTIVFAFVLGDEGTYKQYLAIYAHASFIPAVLAVLLTPVRISLRDPQFSLSVGSFLVFLEPGYLLNVFRQLDLMQIWAFVVAALGVHAIDRRRSVGGALAILLVLMLLRALIFARFLPTGA
jgi:Yip1 domain